MYRNYERYMPLGVLQLRMQKANTQAAQMLAGSYGFIVLIWIFCSELSLQSQLIISIGLLGIFHIGTWIIGICIWQTFQHNLKQEITHKFFIRATVETLASLNAQPNRLQQEMASFSAEAHADYLQRIGRDFIDSVDRLLQENEKEELTTIEEIKRQVRLGEFNTLIRTPTYHFVSFLMGCILLDSLSIGGAWLLANYSRPTWNWLMNL